jgi:arginine decarboxylase
VQADDDGRGLFVELHDADRDRLEDDLKTTLGAMRLSRDVEFGPVQMVIASRLCAAQPVCALAVAVYACEPW